MGRHAGRIGRLFEPCTFAFPHPTPPHPPIYASHPSPPPRHPHTRPRNVLLGWRDRRPTAKVVGYGLTGRKVCCLNKSVLDNGWVVRGGWEGQHRPRLNARCAANAGVDGLCHSHGRRR